MVKVFILSLFMMIFAGQLPADQVVDIEAHLKKTIQEQVKNECETCTIELYIHNSKILEDIAVPDRVIADRWRGQTNLVLQLGEDNRIVTVTIRWKDHVVIAKSNIRQGQVIHDSDVKLVEKDVTFLQTPYLSQVEGAVGWEPRKIFKRGQIIDEGYLKRPLVIKYGQPLKVYLDEGSLQLTMSGTAKGAGAIGDRIPIYLNDTKKRLSAIILGRGEVKVQ